MNIGTLYDSIPGGTYTVFMRDLTDPGCEPLRKKVVVESDANGPLFNVVVINHLTACLPEFADGSLKIGFPTENRSRYRFDWFAGAGTSGDSLTTGNSLNKLWSGVYTVRATDLITGCISEQQVTVEDRSLEIPTPSVNIIQHRTSCTETNGHAIATVGGETDGYIFHWI